MTTETRSEHLSHLVIKNAFSVILLTLVAVGSVLTIHSYQQARDNLANDLRILADILGNRSVASLVFFDKRQASENLKASKYRQSVLMTCIYDSNGRLFSEFVRYSTNQCANAASIAREKITVNSEHIEIEKPIIDSQETVGFIFIRASKKQIEDTVVRVLITSSVTFVVVMLLAFIVLTKKMGRALKPLASLHQTAEEISINPFSKERATAYRNDEVGRLVNVFNSMLDNLNRENHALLDSENRFRSLANNSPVGIYELDEDLNFIYTNEKWQELTQQADIKNLTEYQKFMDLEGVQLQNAVIEKARISKSSQPIEYNYQSNYSDAHCIMLEYTTPIFSAADEQCFKGYIGTIMDISELKNAQLELEKLAFCDPLTDLPNRRFFLDHLAFSLAAKQDLKSVGLLMMDIDNFKKINDTLGHDAGDEMLKVVSDRLRRFVASKDLVCRLGGDEFIILLKDIKQKQALQKISERVLEAIQMPMNIRGHDIDATVSIGVAVYPEDGKDYRELMRNADLALYLSKDKGKNCISFFSRQLETSIHEKVRLETKLRKAIEQNQLTFHVQPKLAMWDRTLISGETLMRWFDPDEGMIPPDRFIPIAEDTGLIIDIGNWLIDEVFRSINERRTVIADKGLKGFAINLSARQFYSSSLVDNISQALKKHHISPDMIEFELTESSVIEDVELAIKIMQQIKSLGCRISIDDFGTGYSSLSYLKRFPIDAVKIDRSFISDIPQDKNDMEISAAIIAMAHKLGLEVVAEGVETQEQLDFLTDQKCEYAQGYYISRPVTLDALLESVDDINQRYTNTKESELSAII